MSQMSTVNYICTTAHCILFKAYTKWSFKFKQKTYYLCPLVWLWGGPWTARAHEHSATQSNDLKAPCGNARYTDGNQNCGGNRTHSQATPLHIWQWIAGGRLPANGMWGRSSPCWPSANKQRGRSGVTDPTPVERGHAANQRADEAD